MSQARRMRMYETTRSRTKTTADKEASVAISAQLLYERFKHEIEVFAENVLSGFEEELSSRITEHFVEHSTEQRQHVEKVSHMHKRAPTIDHKRTREVEVDVQPRSRKALKSRRHSPLKGKKQNWWYKLTDKQKQEIIARRMKAAAATYAAKQKGEAA